MVDFQIPPSTPTPPSFPPRPPRGIDQERLKQAGSWFKATLQKPWFVVSVTGFVVLLVVGISINRIMSALLHSRPEVLVPRLEGKSLSEALRIVSEADLALSQEGVEFDEGMPAGTVIQQHPAAGIHVRAGRAIRVRVSKGGQVVFVPAVIGRPVEEAQSMISAERLQMGAVRQVYSVDAKEGTVISQSPSSGTMVTRGALIDIQVSKGLPPAGVPLVPDFTGQSRLQVESWAQGVNAVVKVSEDPRGTSAAGTVFKQDPAPNQPLMEGDVLKVTIVPSAAGDRFTYHVPSDAGEVSVRFVARDNRGENEIYKGTHKGGETIEIPMSITSTARVHVYLDDTMVEERVVEPD